MFECYECGKLFAQKSSLRKHIKHVHGIVQATTKNNDCSNSARASPKTAEKIIVTVCSDCGLSFLDTLTFKNHRNAAHAEETAPPNKKMSVICNKCSKSFSHTTSLRRHLNEVHGIKATIVFPDNSKLVPLMVCRTCNDKFSCNSHFEAHIKSSHGFNPLVERSTHASVEDFKDWKHDIEERYASRFVTRTSRRHFDKTYYYYRCHRAGPVRFRVSDHERKRERKVQVSCKMNFHCPAMIRAAFLSDGSVEVEFHKSHFGHDVNFTHLGLSALERRDIALKIDSGVPFDNIIEECRKSFKGELKRVHLVDRGDLRNIVTEFSLDRESVRRPAAVCELDAWVEKEKCLGDDSCVILYKPRDAHLPEFPKLKRENFLLAIMNRGQAEVFKTFGHNVICMVSSHVKNAHGYRLTTLLVQDDLRQGFPAAFYISDKNDQESFVMFLEKIKAKVGTLNTRVMLTDTAEAFVNAWNIVMGEVEIRLDCARYVLRDWKKNVDNFITDDGTKKGITCKIRELLVETDAESFQRLYSVIVGDLINDPRTQGFGEYFHENYGNNADRWAYCYRKNAGVDTDVGLEKLHSEIKRSYFGGKGSKRMDIAIHALMKLTDQKLFYRVASSKKETVTRSIRELRRRHKLSLVMSLENVIGSNDSWKVIAGDSNDQYKVTLKEPSCQCSLICRPCNSCPHKFVCSCIDSCLKSNMCKHIHLVCRFISSRENCALETTEANVRSAKETAISLTAMDVEEVNEMSETEETLARVLELKKSVSEEFHTILQQCTSAEELLALRAGLNRTNTNLSSIRNRTIDQQHMEGEIKSGISHTHYEMIAANESSNVNPTLSENISVYFTLEEGMEEVELY